MLFVATYLLCGLSDILDGYLARKYKWESKTGEQLDSFSDFIFYGIIIYLLIITTDISQQKYLMSCTVAVFTLRLINLVITKVKFCTWGMLHSWGNKATGLFLYFYLAATLRSGRASVVPGTILCVAAVLSSVEEGVILLLGKEYNANRKSYFIKH